MNPYVYLCLFSPNSWTAIAQSVQRLATGWTVRGSNHGGSNIFRNSPDLPGTHPALYTLITKFLSRG